MSQVILAYFGPETVLPLTSLFAAAAGVILMFGRQARLLCRAAYHKVLHAVGRGPKHQESPLQRAGKRLDRAAQAPADEFSASPNLDVATNQAEV